MIAHACKVCLGARRLGGEKCSRCKGTGYEPKPRTLIRKFNVIGIEDKPPILPQVGEPYPLPPEK